MSEIIVTGRQLQVQVQIFFFNLDSVEMLIAQATFSLCAMKNSSELL